MIIGSRGCDRKIIVFIAVPFGIYAIERNGLNGKNISNQCFLRPSGIDFTGGNIFNIIFIFDIIVFGCGSPMVVHHGRLYIRGMEFEDSFRYPASYR